MLTTQQARETLHEMLCSQVDQERADALRMAVGLMDGEIRAAKSYPETRVEPTGDPRPRYSVTIPEPAWASESDLPVS